jgi:hypothetical protein
LKIPLRQIEDGNPFIMTLEVGIYSEANSSQRIETLHLTLNEQDFVFSLSAEPSEIILDPNRWLLMQANFHRKK